MVQPWWKIPSSYFQHFQERYQGIPGRLMTGLTGAQIWWWSDPASDRSGGTFVAWVTFRLFVIEVRGMLSPFMRTSQNLALINGAPWNHLVIFAGSCRAIKSSLDSSCDFWLICRPYMQSLRAINLTSQTSDWCPYRLQVSLQVFLNDLSAFISKI